MQGEGTTGAAPKRPSDLNEVLRQTVEAVEAECDVDAASIGDGLLHPPGKSIARIAQTVAEPRLDKRGSLGGTDGRTAESSDRSKVRGHIVDRHA